MLLAFELGPIRAFGSLHAVSLHQYPIPDRTVSTFSSSSHLLPSLSHLSRCTGRLHRLVEVDERSIAAAFKVGRVYDMSNIDIAAFVEPIIDDWSEAEDLQLLLSPPWDTSAEKIIDSIIYTLFFRAVPALISLIIGVNACVLSIEYYKRGAEWAPGRVICFAQAPVNFSNAIWSACGSGLRSTIIPISLNAIQYSIYCVATTASTLLIVVRSKLPVALTSCRHRHHHHHHHHHHHLPCSFLCTQLFMRESTLAIREGRRRRNAWKLHRWKLASFVVGMYFIFSTYLTYVYKANATTGALEQKSKFVLGISFAIYYTVTLAVNVAYVAEAYKYFRPLQLHIRHPGSNPSKEHVQKIERVVFYVVVSIISTSLVSIALMIWTINRLCYPEPLWAFALELGVVVWCRCLANYSQMKAITPSAGTFKKKKLQLVYFKHFDSDCASL